MKGDLNSVQLWARQKAIWTMHNDGLSLQEIADIFRVSKPLVQKLVDSGRHIIHSDLNYHAKKQRNKLRTGRK